MAEKYHLVARFQQVDNEVSLLPMYMVGGALALYMQLEENDQKDIDQTETRLKKAFADDAVTMYRKPTMVRGTSKRVDVFTNKIRHLVGLASFERALRSSERNDQP